MSLARSRSHASAGPLTVAAGAVGLLVAIAIVALHTRVGQNLDDRAMGSVVAGREAETTVLSVLGRVSIGAVLAVALVCVALALARGQNRLAVIAVAVLVGANVTTQVLKRVVLDRAVLDVIAPNSLPSGHTTVVAGAVGALLLVSPRALRLLVVIGGAFAVTITGASTLVAGWHRPADVAAALAVVIAWTALGAWAVGGGHRPVHGSVLGALAGAAGGLVVLVAIGVRPSYGWSGFAEAALVLSVLALATALAVALMERLSPTAAP